MKSKKTEQEFDFDFDNELFIVQHSPSQNKLHYMFYSEGKHQGSLAERGDWYGIGIVRGSELEEFLERKAKQLGIRGFSKNVSESGEIAVDSASKIRIRFAVLRRDGYKCRLCGRDKSDGVKLEASHIIADSKGGDYSMDNLITACFDCNRGMGVDEP